MEKDISSMECYMDSLINKNNNMNEAEVQRSDLG